MRLRLAGFLFLFCFLAAGAGRVLAAPPAVTLSLQEYRQMVSQSIETVDGLKDLPPDEQRIELDRLAAQWQAVDRVELPDGLILPIDHSYLCGLFRADPPDLDRLESALQALDQALAESVPAPYDPEDLEKLKAILASPEFQWKESASGESQDFWSTAWNAIAKFLEGLFSGMSGGVTIALPGLQYLMILGIGIILVVVLFFAGRWLVRSFVSDADEKNGSENDDENLSADEAMRKANMLSEGGDYRTAIRYLYLASLLWMDEHGMLRYDRTRTNREYLKSISGLPELARPFRQVIDLFDRVWYGFQKPDEEEYRQYRSHVDELRNQKP